ncbi:MAG: hypothetical protein NT033_10445 [Candidatus Omnitrophica bacterium]|nr:hypothetical protein [Candidatus Omnitrophota bacterium]
MRRIWQPCLIIFFLVVFVPFPIFADQLVLNSGKKVEGRVVEQKDDYVIIEVKGINMMYRRFEIKDVVVNPGYSASSQSRYISTTPNPQPEEVPESKNTEPTGSTRSIRDPKTAEALNKFNAQMIQIGKDCKAPGKDSDFMELLNQASECICKHLPETVKVNQIRIAALVDLMKRRPELVYQVVRIDGVSGFWFLNPEDADKNTIEGLSRAYNCK